MRVANQLAASACRLRGLTATRKAPKIRAVSTFHNPFSPIISLARAGLFLFQIPNPTQLDQER